MLKPAHELYPWEGPMPVLHLEGSPREMGRAHGEACRDWIRLTVENYWQSLQSSPLDLSRQDILDGISESKRAVVRYTDEAYLDEMRSIAEGAGLEHEDIFLAHCMFDLAIIHSDPIVQAQTFSQFERLSPQCSAFAAWGQATEGGEMICTHNNDGPRYPGQFMVMVVVRPEQGYSFMYPTTVGRAGQHSMMNSQGLVIVGTALDNGAKTRTGDIGVPLGIIFRHVVQHCDTTAQAVEVLAGLRLTTPGNFLIADRHGHVELVQAALDHRVSLKPDPHRDYLLVTNHALVEEIKPHLSLRPYPGSTHYRHHTISQDLEANYGHINEDMAKQMMSSHHDWSVQGIHPCENTPCRHHEYKGELGGTKWTCVWNLDDLSGHVSLGNPCKGNWVFAQFPG